MRLPPTGSNILRKVVSPPMASEKTGTSDRRAISRSSSNEAWLEVSIPSVTSTTALLSAGPGATRRMASMAAS